MAAASFPPPRPDRYKYMTGFGNEFATEARPGTLPVGQNSPQKCAEGLYAEQISGTAFTAPRHENRRTWYYRTLPSAVHEPFEKIDNGLLLKDASQCGANPNQLRWPPPPIPSEPTDFVQGLITMAGSGSPETKAGIMVHYYVANRDMVDKAFYNSDGEMLIVPQQGILDIQTELGMLEVFPGEICVIPRGILFSVKLPDQTGRGYICEVFDSHFRLPNLGPIGANGLANPRDFKYPVAHYEDRKAEFTVINKFLGQLFACKKPCSPFNVVAWHGNLAPYKYDLDYFCTMNAVSFDHPDPSIYCVLTAPTALPGIAACDFVIFPPRWEVKDHTFRPPWYHRNCMSEFMGLIRGEYEAKVDGGFVPGGSSLHSCMTGHGPDKASFEKASTAELVPFKLPDTMAFMFESSYIFKVSEYAEKNFEKGYYKCWQDLHNYHSDFLAAQK